jgi:hypothetical protein
MTTTIDASKQLTREKSAAMVTNMLRVALHTVTFCRGAHESTKRETTRRARADDD